MTTVLYCTLSVSAFAAASLFVAFLTVWSFAPSVGASALTQVVVPTLDRRAP